ncbi:protocadherin gamma-B6-like [Penaeus monodon]|uniref:protocadherin gamma-B6-like n=1 Tax=Penaeus monodon TaxID=6687 RepID=UPI0018A714DE|nr:protocadherin gamma-B6-like [Penaeus monodon]
MPATLEAMAPLSGTRGGLLLLLLLVAAATKPAEGLRLQQAVRPARIYASAPSGVGVTVVRAVESSPAHTPAGTSSAHAPTPAGSSPARLPSSFGHYTPRYYLYKSNVTDHRYFAINEFGGNITTARFIDRAVDKEYRLIVVVLVGGRATNQELSIRVTQYNQYAPRLALDQYSAEVVVTADTGTPLLTVEAADDDEVGYNREIYYFLTSPEAGTEVDPFLEPPSWSPVGVDRDTGELRVTRALSLEASPLRLVVGAADGGSPQRYAFANITIYIRNMSEPLHVTVNNSTESSLEVCWSPPAHGRPQGYVLTYTPTTAHKTYEKGSLNLTLDELHSRVVAPGADEGVSPTPPPPGRERGARRGGGPWEILPLLPGGGRAGVDGVLVSVGGGVGGGQVVPRAAPPLGPPPGFELSVFG